MQKSYAYYNEFDPFAADWLRQLIKAGVIAPGIVDQRSITDVTPNELREFTQCHFFAGIGVWSYALRQAGWSDDRPVWTGSCPCQPFSVAGQGNGVTDERHLWPSWFHLIQQSRPDVVFGEQVEAAVKHGWLDLVQADMEGVGYAFGAAGIPAAGVGAPHIRQRLWFVAHKLEDALGVRRSGWGDGNTSGHGRSLQTERRSTPSVDHTVEYRDIGLALGLSLSESEARNSNAGGLAHDNDEGLQGRVSGRTNTGRQVEHGHIGRDSAVDVVANPDVDGCESGDAVRPDGQEHDAEHGGRSGGAGPTNGFWRDADWLYCKDEKWRPVEPGTFPLANGITNRVGRLRGYGNAIVSEVAENFIKAYTTITTTELN